MRGERDRVELVQKSQSRLSLHSTLFHDAPKAPSHFLVFRRLFSSSMRVEKGNPKTAASLLSEESVMEIAILCIIRAPSRFYSHFSIHFLHLFFDCV